MYREGYGIIETLAPLHVGASAGEESGNLNLIFRDSLTQTGIIPGSSIRGRLRADTRMKTASSEPENSTDIDEASLWYGRASEKDRKENVNYESLIKIEHASIVWMPIFCPGQPIVWVSSPRLLQRYKRIKKIEDKVPDKYTGSQTLKPRKIKNSKQILFFNLGFLEIEKPDRDLSVWLPDGHQDLPAVIVDDSEIGMIHDMGLYRQSRVALEEHRKVVADKAFFDVEALPEGTLLIFPLALKPTQQTWDDWKPLKDGKTGDIYLGGLESAGFGHCQMQIYSR